MPSWQLDDLGENTVRHDVSNEAALRSALETLADLMPRVVLIGINANECMHIGIGGRHGD